MADLEESFLKSNIPGRYSAWADGDRDAKEQNEADQNDDLQAPSFSTAAAADGGPTALNRLEASTSRNTGAKGVLADRRAAKEEEAYRREVERRETEAILDRAVRGTTMAAGQVSSSLAAEEERRRVDKIRNRQKECEESSSDGHDSYDDEDDEDDEEFMRHYRQKRLLELQQNAAASSVEQPYGGQVEDVTPIQYAEAVDETDPRTLLVVHLYEPHIPACVDVNNHLETLARSTGGTSCSSLGNARFLRLRATEAKSDLDLVGLPSVLVYRGGQLMENWTPITQHLPPRFTAEDLQSLLLESCGAGSCGAMNTSTANASAGIARGGSYDSDDAELDEYCADFDG